jgi:hypothetical protein
MMRWLGLVFLVACSHQNPTLSPTSPSDTAPVARDASAPSSQPGEPGPDSVADAASPDAGVRGRFCGGIAGFQCPAGQVCVDNPNDDCDPAHGGADCGGVCRPAP